MVQPLPASEVTHARRRLDGGRARALRDDVGGAGAIPEARDRPPDVQVPRPATPGLGRGGVAGRREAAGRAAAGRRPGLAPRPSRPQFPGRRSAGGPGWEPEWCERLGVRPCLSFPRGGGASVHVEPRLIRCGFPCFCFFPRSSGVESWRDAALSPGCALEAQSPSAEPCVSGRFGVS